MENNHVIIKRNQLLIHATIGMNLKNIMVIERSLTKKHAQDMIPVI